jgi:gamma-glutamyltranspeptidase/glutathione hydrolase
MDLERAIQSSRIHLEGNILHCEPEIPIHDEHELPDGMTIHQWGEQNLFFGGVNAVTPEEAVGDPRRGGSGLIC